VQQLLERGVARERLQVDKVAHELPSSRVAGALVVLLQNLGESSVRHHLFNGSIEEESLTMNKIR